MPGYCMMVIRKVGNFLLLLNTNNWLLLYLNVRSITLPFMYGNASLNYKHDTSEALQNLEIHIHDQIIIMMAI